MMNYKVMNLDIRIPGRLLQDKRLNPTDWLICGVIAASVESYPVYDGLSDEEVSTMTNKEIGDILMTTPETAGVSVSKLLKLKYLDGNDTEKRVLSVPAEERSIFQSSTNIFRPAAN